MIVLLTLACSLSMAQEPVEQSYPVDYGAVQQQAQQMLTDIDANDLSSVSVSLDDSKTGATSTLSATFTVVNSVAAGGKIMITFPLLAR